MTPEQLTFLAIVAVTLILFISETLRIDIAAMLTLLALAVDRILTPPRPCRASRASPPSSSPRCSSISAALTETGLTERIGAGIARPPVRANGARSWS